MGRKEIPELLRKGERQTQAKDSSWAFVLVLCVLPPQPLHSLDKRSWRQQKDPHADRATQNNMYSTMGRLELPFPSNS